MLESDRKQGQFVLILSDVYKEKVSVFVVFFSIHISCSSTN